MPTAKRIFITGVSSGFGREIAVKALADGHRVIGTVRSQEALRKFEALEPGRSFARMLDVTDFGVIDDLVADVECHIGAIDVLINNAGYGHEGLVEESPLDELRRQFDVNVFGAVAVIKAIVPYLRKRRRGHIVNITSMGGFITMPGVAYYCGSKFAMEGISEALGKELSPFGVKVTAVAPGSFRTDWAGRSMVRTPREIPDYDDFFDPIRKARQEKSGKQLGNPAKAAKAILDLLSCDHPPSHLLLGSDALSLVREKLHACSREIDEWEPVTQSTDG